MGFLEKVPENIQLLEKEIKQSEWAKRDFYGHECDCEFCDRQEDGRDEDELDKLEKQIKDNQIMIDRLERYQTLWKAVPKPNDPVGNLEGQNGEALPDTNIYELKDEYNKKLIEAKENQIIPPKPHQP